jgi:hypothetical protein
VILAAYRSGELDLEEAQAFTHHAEQERISSELKAGCRRRKTGIFREQTGERLW